MRFSDPSCSTLFTQNTPFSLQANELDAWYDYFSDKPSERYELANILRSRTSQTAAEPQLFKNDPNSQLMAFFDKHVAKDNTLKEHAKQASGIVYAVMLMTTINDIFVAGTRDAYICQQKGVPVATASM